ncbi:hypothetical protein ACB094_05G059900 [Castanea mollissima]
MESGDIYKAGSSFRLSSPSMWRDTSMEVFSKSSREDDDEEALIWAALQKLPTYNRLTKGLLTTPQGETSEIDVHHHGLREKGSLIERLVKVPEEDHEKFLYKLKDRLERVGIVIPTIEVHFEHLNVEAEAHVGSRAFFEHLSKKTLVESYIKPSRMTLLLGPPSSGKTSLLLNLAGELDPDLKFIPQRTAAYVSQHDLHIGEMTVRESLAFSARCPGVGSRNVRRKKEANIKPDPDVDIYMKAMATEGQEVNVVTDYILKIVNSIKQYVHILNGTAVISLFQPASKTYNLYDDIILISDGQIVYQGPRELLEFFESMAFKCPERKGVADFLQQEQYWAQKDEPYNFVTIKDFTEAFQSFHVGQKLKDGLVAQFDRAKRHPVALTTRKYGVKKAELLKACLSREFLLMKRNSFVYIFKFIQIVKIPITFVEVDVWVFITYYVIGFDPSAGRFFRQYLLLLLLNQMAYALFPFIGAIGRRDPILANTFGSFALVMLFALGGFVLSREEDVGCKVLYFINNKDQETLGYKTLRRKDAVASFRENKASMSLMMYAQNAIVVNEFLGKSWRHVLPNSMEPLGIEVLKSCRFFTHAYWYWIGVGALIGFILLFNAAFTLALTYLNPLGKPQSAKSEEPQSNGQDYRSRENNKSHKTSIGDIFLTIHACLCNGYEIMRGSIASSPSSISVDTSTEINQNWKRGMILPFDQYTITFDEIKYSEMKNQGVTEDKLELLKGVSSAFRPGVLTALIGVSGAGKTTLMDVLAGRKTGGYIDGKITISRYPKKQETFARVSGYCEQNDIYSTHVTVYQSLLYSAWLHFSPDVDCQKKKIFVEEVTELVELKPVNGLSTEQCKRLTIVVELVANPSIIFMDEPTSELDARAAAIPSIDIFEAFDGLFLMKLGGLEIYVGPLGRHSCHLIQYFELLHRHMKTTLGIDFTNMYRNSELYRTSISMLNTHTHTQFMACLRKQHWSYWRNPLYTAVRFIFTTVIALMFGTMTKQQDLFNARGSMYAAVLFIGVKNGNSVQPVVAIERIVFYRERAAEMYSALPYALAQPWSMVLLYVLIGFEWTAAKFFWYLFFTYFSLLYFTFYGMMIVAVTPNPYKDMLDTGERVEDFVRDYFGFNHDFLGVVAAVIVGFVILFAFIFAVSIKVFNFQRR